MIKVPRHLCGAFIITPFIYIPYFSATAESSDLAVAEKLQYNK